MLHTEHTHLLALRQENNARLWNPGIEFEKTGPIQTWEKTWVNTNWCSTDGKLRIPQTILKVDHSNILKSIIPIAWKLHPAWHVVTGWIIQQQNSSLFDVDTTGTSTCINSSFTIVYTDGAYNRDNRDIMVSNKGCRMRRSDYSLDISLKLKIEVEISMKFQ